MTKIHTLAAEDFQPGSRYWDVNPGAEDAWTIASVVIIPEDHEVWRDGGWVSVDTVVITRRDGDVRRFERGEEIAIMGPWKTDADTGPASAAMTTAEKKRKVAEALMRQAGTMLEFWDADDADGITHEEAQAFVATWLKRLPGDAWDTRLGNA